MFLSWNVELALTGNFMAAASSITGAACTSCGCGVYVHHVIQSWIMILMQTCHVQGLLQTCHVMSCRVTDSVGNSQQKYCACD